MAADPNRQILTVPQHAQGQRLDRWLTQQLPSESRSAIQRWIGAGAIVVDGRPTQPAQRLEAGQVVTVEKPPVVSSRLEAQAIALTIVYEDDDIIVVDKPAGLVVHPGPGHSHDTLVNAVLHYCPEIEGVGGEKRPGIVHRLDKETSGLILVAKNDQSHRALQQQFAARTVHKEYLALLEGVVAPENGRIVAPIGRHPTHRQRMAVVPPNPLSGQSRGREAITVYTTEGIYSTRLTGGDMGNFALVRAQPKTGRTHQIRVHFAWLKHPLVGDRLYGYRRQRLTLERHFLHAQRLDLRLPSGQDASFVSPLPPDLAQLLDSLS